MLHRLLILAATASLTVLAPAAEKFDAAVATNQLGLDLYRQLAKENPAGNLVVSPYSIDSAIALAYAGADGATRAEMASVLHFPVDDASVQISFDALRVALDEIAAKEDSVELHQANRLFSQLGYAFRPTFISIVEKGYSAPWVPLDFRTKPEDARNTINEWVSAETQRKILDLIPSGGVTDHTRLVLVNALYLKAQWVEKFKKKLTKQQPFHVSGTKTLNVPTMERTAYVGYEKRDGLTVVSLTYRGWDLQFIIILPDEGASCDAVGSKLTTQDLKSWATLSRRENDKNVTLFLPKFRLQEPTLELGQYLRALGIKQAFDDPRGSANFDRIAARQPTDYLALSEIFHKTFIAIDEEGTESAAASGIMVMTSFGVHDDPPPFVVRVDRPFLFAIQDRTSGVCLFLGRITDPR